MGQRIHHNEGCERARDETRGNREETALMALVVMMTPSQRPHEKPEADQDDENGTGCLQGEVPPGAYECALHDHEARQDKLDRHAHMGENQKRA